VGSYIFQTEFAKPCAHLPITGIIATSVSFAAVAIILGLTAGDKLGVRLGWFSLLLGLVVGLVGFPNMLDCNSANLDGPASYAVRSITVANGKYRALYPERGFAPSLQALGGSGGSAAAAGLLESSVTSGRDENYTMIYTPGPTDSAGRILRYTLSARPRQYQVTGTRSYFADESGIVRWTNENRPATKNDAPLQ
jgi:hypothetical protein